MDDADPATIRTRAEFGAALTALRTAAGLTVRELARQVDRPPGTLGDYLSGRHVPSPAQQSLIVDVLAVCGVHDSRDVEAWMSALRRVRASTDRRTTRSAAPYRGLKPFEPEDAALFFGRREQTDEIARRLRQLWLQRGPSHGILAVIGPSGSGKSSLLRAGVVAAVRGGALDDDDTEWSCAIITPGDDPAAAFAAAVRPAAGPRIVVIDQFEEIFTLTHDPGVRTAFLDTLADPGPDVVVAVGMRADFFASAAREPVLLAALQHAQVVVGPMTSEQVRQAVTGPAAQIGVSVEEGLADVVLADLAPSEAGGGAHDAGSLPLLSHALLATWERSSGRRLTIADYRATGGLDAAVQRTAEEVFTGLDEAQQDAAHDLFVRLVNVGDDVALTRRRISRTELGLDTGVTHDDTGRVREVIDRFVTRRLLTVTATTVEVSHEALLTAWPRLHGWLDTDRAGLVVHRRITTGANAWQAADRDPAALLTGAALETAAEWAAVPTHLRRMTGVESAFVDAGLHRRDELVRLERRRTRRLAQLLAAVAVLALVAGGLAIWARMAQHDADHEQHAASSARDQALSRQVAFQSRELNDADPALAQQLALAAYRIAPSAVAEAALVDESATPVVTRVLGPLGPTPLALAPARRIVAVGHADGTVHLFALRSGRVPIRLATVPALSGRQQIFGLAFTPDGTTLATGGEARQIRLWDVSDPRRPHLRATFEPHFSGAVESIVFGAGGRTLVTGSVGSTPVEQWAVAPVTHPVRLAPPAGIPASVTINALTESAGGTELAAATDAGSVLIWPGSDPSRTPPRRISTGTANVGSVAFLPVRHAVILGARDGSVQIWSDTAVPRRLHTLTGVNNAIATTISVRPDQSAFAVGFSDGSLRQWHVADWQPLSTVGNPGPVTGSAFAADSRTLLTTAADGTLRLAPAGDRTITVTGTVFGMAYTAHGHLLLEGDNGPSAGVRLWDVSDPAIPRPRSPFLAMPPGTDSSDGTAAVTADGTLVATGNRSGKVQLWATGNPATPQAEPLFSGSTALIESLSFSPDGRLLAVAGDDGDVALWDVHDPGAPRLLTRLRGASLMLNASFSPDGRLVAGASADDTVYLWDVSDPARPQRVARLRGFTSYVYGLSFNPRSTMLAASSSDHTTRVWDVSTPAHPVLRRGPLIGPTGYALSAAFSPNGHDLAVGSDDHNVRIYDLRTRSTVPVETLTGLAGAVWSLAYDPAGHTLAGAGRADSVVFWSTDDHGYADRLCPLVGDGITRQEWSLYVPGAPYDPPCR